jgi:hypothetical protein
MVTQTRPLAEITQEALKVLFQILSGQSLSSVVILSLFSRQTLAAEQLPSSFS